MPRHRVALVGLGMAVTPHAKSLMDLADRVEVVWAMSPSAARRDAFRGRFAFPAADSLEPILADRSIAAVAVLTPPNTHLEIATELARAGKHVLLEKPLDVSTARAEQLVAACRDVGVTLGVVLQHRFKPAAERLTSLLRGGSAGDIVNCSTSHPAVAAAELLRRAGPRNQGARRRRCADHAGHPHARPDAEPRRPDRGGVRLCAYHARASHGDGGPRVRGRAIRQRRRRRHRRDHRRLSRRSRAHRADRHPGHGLAHRHGARGALPRRPPGEVQPDASPGGTAPTRWPSRTTITWVSGAIFSTLSIRAGRRASPGDEALKVHRLIDALLESGIAGGKVAVR